MQGCLLQETVLFYQLRKYELEGFEISIYFQYNESKLSDRDPEARVCAKRREAKARHVPGFMAGAHAVTEPVESTAARR